MTGSIDWTWQDYEETEHNYSATFDADYVPETEYEYVDNTGSSPGHVVTVTLEPRDDQLGALAVNALVDDGEDTFECDAEELQIPWDVHALYLWTNDDHADCEGKIDLNTTCQT